MTQLYHDSDIKRLSVESSIHPSLVPHFFKLSIASLSPDKVREIASDNVEKVIIEFIRIERLKGSMK